MSTSWLLRMAPTKPVCSNTKQRSTHISRQKTSRFRIRMFFGAAGARSNLRKSRQYFIGNGCARWRRRRRERSDGMIALTEKVRARNDLSALDVQEAVAFLLSDSVEANSKADFLTALHEKGESANEIANFARVLLERAVSLEIDAVDGPIV